ncbi:MAG: hypothetical protein H6974_10940 [Gammaproteobacteria bacterium]|nr:hypothetical protein [Gammaproteobacteria bacterium]
MVDHAANPKSLVNFRCLDCHETFKAEPARILDAPEQDWHPWRYFAVCPSCDREVEQAHWERTLLKAWARQTGPKTADGKARVAKNLIGHPNAEAQRRTRFNGMKHGLSAKVATYYPAKPGGYPHCRSCQWLRNGCGEWDHGACLTRMELFLKHRIAFQTRDPALLNELQADLQSNTQALINDMLLAILNTGIEIRSPQWYSDKEGGFHLAAYEDSEGRMRQIEEISAHPLIKPLYELLSRNSTILSQLGMTQKAQEDDAVVQGFLAQKEKEEESLASYAERQTQALEHLATLVERSRERQKRDPVLIEHQQEDDP